MSNYDNFNTTDRAELERLSLDELNAILDASYEPDSRISMDTLLLVLDVIEKRVGKTPSPSLDAAWETIKKEHLHSDEQGAEAEHETDIKNEQSIKPKTNNLFLRVVGIAAAVAIVIFTAGSLIPTANGSNLWSAFVEWTRDTFGYSTENVKKDTDIPTQLQALKDLIQDCGLPASELLPTYIPDGYETTTTLCDERENATVFLCELNNGDNSIVLQYRLLDDIDAFTEYQKNEDDIEAYSPKGTEDIFYLVGNLELFTAIWADGNMECSIQNVPSREELIRMIDSIYEGT